MEAISPHHPRHKLAFYVDQEVDFEIRAAVSDFVGRIASSRNWSLRAPEYFDIHKVPEDQTRGDCCTDDVGGFIEIYSGWPPWSVPREIDIRQFEEVKALLRALEAFSRERGLDFEVHFAGEVIGRVANGRTRGVQEMLLHEWGRSLGLSS